MRLLGSLACLALLPSAAAAEADSASRDDISELRRTERLQQRQAERREAAREARQQDFLLLDDEKDGIVASAESADKGAAISANLSLTGLYSTNAGQVRSPVVGSFYGAPAFTVDLAYPADEDASWHFNAEIAAESDFYAKTPDEYDESRLLGFVDVTHQSSKGDVLRLAVKPQAAFGSAYSSYGYTRVGFLAAFSPAFGQALGLRGEAEYRLADKDSQKRALFTLFANRTLHSTKNKNGSDFKVSYSQSFRYSLFRAGENDGRRDMLSKSTLKLDPGLFRKGVPLSLTFEVSLYHNLSNRRDNRFTDLQVGPTLSFDF